MRETHLAMLRHHPFVVEFESRHVEKLAMLAREIRFERDHVIFREGDECSEFYLIVTGLVALEIAAPGHTFRVQTLFAGDELGWSALLMGSGKHFQARTLDRVEALAFEGSELLAACREDAAGTGGSVIAGNGGSNETPLDRTRLGIVRCRRRPSCAG